MNDKLYRHGDVWMRKITELPEGEAIKTSSVKLALGEATGHAHTLQIPVGAMLQYWGKDGDVTHFELPSIAELTHNEHKMLKIEPGIYEIIREQEYDYFKDEIRRVAD